LLLQRKDINIEYNYECTRGFHTLFLEIVTELGKECTPKQCLKMTGGPNWEFKCTNHGNMKNLNCCAIDYCTHTLDTIMPLLTNPIFFPDRDKIYIVSLSETV
jgi:hypothetical protein